MEEVLYDGQALKKALKSAETLLEKRIDEINSLNVFPVPDGDTGINMFLTLQAANEAIKDNQTTSASEIASKAAMGALMGARGNSGVIFSQIMRGMAKGLAATEKFTKDFAGALHNASETAYKALSDPVEGTILTVIREASDKAVEVAETGADLKKIMAAVTTRAEDTVNRTPDLLPPLKEAGVVDAGGKGLFYFFLGMKNFIIRKLNPVEGIKTVRRKACLAAAKSEYGYDLQFLITGVALSAAEIRTKISTMGESVLVVGDEDLIRVHIHTRDSQAVMDYCATKGMLSDIINDNMDTQVETFKKRKNGGYPEARLDNSPVAG